MSGIRLKNIEVVEAGMVIVSAGIRSQYRAGKEDGIETKKEWLSTSAGARPRFPASMPAATVHKYHDGNYGIWPEAGTGARLRAPTRPGTV